MQRTRRVPSRQCKRHILGRRLSLSSSFLRASLPDSITNRAPSPIIEEFGIQYPPIGCAVAVTRVLGSQFTGCHLHCDSLSLHYRLLSDHRRRESMTSTRSRIATSRLFSLQTNQCDQRRQRRARSKALITSEISLRWARLLLEFQVLFIY